MKNRKLIFATFVAVGTFLVPSSVSAITKSETIYSNLEYDGKIEKSSVTNHLSFLKEQEEKDDTVLKDILNINGDEKFKTDGNKIIWENKGRDIFYRGTTDTLLPIDVEIEYFFNGKKRNPKKMVGKSGEVKIVYHFINRDKKVVQIMEQSEEIYTPFVVSVGMVMEGKNNKDFSITNGKVISTGSRSMIVGLASPGLYESTGIAEFECFDDITLTYTTSHFSLANTYIVATPKLLSESEFASLGKIEGIYQNMQALDENMQKLVSGTDEISNGSVSLYDGSKSLRYNIEKIKNASSQLKSGSVQLNYGLTTLKNAILQMKAEIQNKLQGKSISEVTAALQNLKVQNNTILQNTLQKSGKTFNELQTIYVQNNLQNYQIQGESDPLGLVKNAYELCLALSGNNSAIDMSLSFLSSFQQVEILLSSIEQLESFSSTLKEGLDIMEAGTIRLHQGSIEIESGMKKLVDGSNALKEGAKNFQEQGIKQLVNYSKILKKYNNKMDALIDLSKGYSGFASQNSDSTLFVYTVSSIK